MSETIHCVCGAEFPTEERYRAHVRAMHYSASYGAWKAP